MSQLMSWSTKWSCSPPPFPSVLLAVFYHTDQFTKQKHGQKFPGQGSSAVCSQRWGKGEKR